MNSQKGVKEDFLMILGQTEKIISFNPYRNRVGGGGGGRWPSFF